MSSTPRLNERSTQAKALPAAIVALPDDAIVSKDLAGTVTSWNQGATRLFGYHAVEIVGHPIRLLIPPELFGEETEILASIMHDERVDPFATIRRRNDGTRVEVSVTVSPIHDETGRVTGALKVARDISGRGFIGGALRADEDPAGARVRGGAAVTWINEGAKTLPSYSAGSAPHMTGASSLAT